MGGLGIQLWINGYTTIYPEFPPLIQYSQSEGTYPNHGKSFLCPLLNSGKGDKKLYTPLSFFYRWSFGLFPRGDLGLVGS